MADICLRKYLPTEISDYIQKKIHKARMKEVIKEYKTIIIKTFYNKLISDSGGIGYICSSNTNNHILYKDSPLSFLNSLMWYEFWTEFTNLPTYPKRNLTPMLAHRITTDNLYNKTPFKTTPKSWLV